MSSGHISVLQKTSPNLLKLSDGIAFLDGEDKELADNDPAKIKYATHQREMIFILFE